MNTKIDPITVTVKCCVMKQIFKQLYPNKYAYVTLTMQTHCTNFLTLLFKNQMLTSKIEYSHHLP